MTLLARLARLARRQRPQRPWGGKPPHPVRRSLNPQLRSSPAGRAYVQELDTCPGNQTDNLPGFRTEMDTVNDSAEDTGAATADHDGELALLVRPADSFGESTLDHELRSPLVLKRERQSRLDPPRYPIRWLAARSPLRRQGGDRGRPHADAAPSKVVRHANQLHADTSTRQTRRPEAATTAEVDHPRVAMISAGVISAGPTPRRAAGRNGRDRRGRG